MGGAGTSFVPALLVSLQAIGPQSGDAREPFCAPQADDEIVVCATGDNADQFRIPRELREPPPEEGPRRVTIDLGDGNTLHAHGEQADVGGWPSRRVMVGVAMPF